MTDGRDGGDVARLSLVLPRDGDRCEIAIGAGLAGSLAELLRLHAPAHAYALISDDRVAALHGERLTAGLEAAGVRARLYRFPAGEASKTPATWAGLVESLAADGLGRDGCVVGVGGGVACDLAGFVAATYLRGVPLVHVPTSLLAMVDAAIGGKGGVDLRAGKNLAGAFWQPRLVLADPGLLGTLPDAELRAGLAEVVKHGAIADAEALERLEADLDAVLARDPGALGRVVADSVRVKTSFVAGDVREAGARAALNFGHTIGHAIERATAYRVGHGAAVSIGMVAEARLGEALGVTAGGTADRLGGVLERLGLPVALPQGATPEAILEGTRGDKKGRAGVVRYVLLRRVGEVARTGEGAWTHEAEDGVVVETLRGVGGGGPRGG